MQQTTRQKSGARVSLDAEWERLNFLVPQIISDYRMVEDIEKDIFNLIDGRSTCKDIVKAQNSYSRDGAVLILLKLERDGIISCIEPAEKLRDVKFERCEAEKELDFTFKEKMKLLDMVPMKREEINNIRQENKRLKSEILSLKKKIECINKNIERSSNSYRDAAESADQLVSKKKDILRRKKVIDKAISIIKEETIFLKDEKCFAMRNIRELESKIDEIIHHRDSVMPKISIYRGVVREAYKTLRDAEVRVEHTLKGVG